MWVVLSFCAVAFWLFALLYWNSSYAFYFCFSPELLYFFLFYSAVFFLYPSMMATAAAAKSAPAPGKCAAEVCWRVLLLAPHTINFFNFYFILSISPMR